MGADLRAKLDGWRGLLARCADFSPLVLAGAGHIAGVLPRLQKAGLAPAFIVDPAPALQGTFEAGLPIRAPEALAGLGVGAGVLVCRLGGVRLARILERQSDAPILDGFSPLGHEAFAPHFDPAPIAEALPDILAARKLFKDEASLALFDALLSFRLTCDLRLLPCPTIPLYFPPEAAPRPGDVILDGGAYDGDTAVSFARTTSGRVRILSFEPDPANFAALRRTIRRCGLERVVEALPLALWRENARLDIHPAGTASRVCEPAGQGPAASATSAAPAASAASAASAATATPAATGISAVSVDFFCASRGLRPTLIKTDLEGADLDALQGAAAVIAAHRPRLALSVYHRPRDLWEIPLMAARLRPGSAFRLISHEAPEPLGDIVCYAFG